MSAEDFLKSLTTEVFRAEDFFDWGRITQRLSRLEPEIQALETLPKPISVESLAELIAVRSSVLDVLHLLTAHEPQALSIAEGGSVDFVTDRHPITAARARELAGIFGSIGLLRMVLGSTSIRDIAFGVLIGFEPNSRKSRRGEVMEDKVTKLLTEKVAEVMGTANRPLQLVSRYSINVGKEDKIVDFAILENMRPLVAVEVNFYSTSGSKPTETLMRAYPELQRALNERDIEFIVITDGAGWLRMKQTVHIMLQKLKYCFTLRQAETRLVDTLLKVLAES